MWKFIVDVVHDFVSSLQPDIGRGFLHVSNVFLFYYTLCYGAWHGGIMVSCYGNDYREMLQNVCWWTIWIAVEYNVIKSV